MTDFEQWCEPPAVNNIGKHAYGDLVSNDDATGISVVSATLGEKYAEVDMLVHSAEQFGKHGVSAYLANKFPTNYRGPRDLFAPEPIDQSGTGGHSET